MKKTLVSCIIILAAMSVVFAMTVYSFADDKKISKSENRTLASKPEFSVNNWFDGKFSVQLDQYLNDHTYGRGQCIEYAGNFESLFRQHQDIKVTKSTNKRKDIGSDALILTDRIVALFIENKDAEQSVAKSSKALFDMVPKKVDKYIMLTPTRSEFENKYCQQYTDSQKDAINRIYKQMDKSVKKIDSYSAMEKAVNNNPINSLFFTTDHHWTAYGAYFGANSLLDAMNKKSVEISDYNRIDSGGFYGYLYAMHKDDSLNVKPDDFVYYTKEPIAMEDAYGVDGADISEKVRVPVIDSSRAGYYTFVETAYQYVVIDGNDKKGGCLLMICDSYASALAPWLTDRYDKIILIDPRYFTGGKEKLQEIMEDYDVDKFMVNLGALVLSSSFGGEMEKLYK